MDEHLTLRRALTLVEQAVSRAKRTGGKLCVTGGTVAEDTSLAGSVAGAL
jgi:hypothetical protein